MIIKRQSIRQPVTKKQLEILSLLYKFRFLDTHIIQLLLHHKLPTRIQSWLQDLTRKEYIHQFYDRTSFVERTKPALYCLSTKSRMLLGTQKNCEPYVLNQIYREKNRSEEFRHHCCYIANLYLKYHTFNADTDGQKTLHFYTKVQLIGYEHFPQPLPDAYFAIRQKGKTTKRYFLEVLDLNIPKRALIARIRRYIESEEGAWKEKTDNAKFPTILLITKNKYKQRNIRKLIQRTRDEAFSYLPFYLTNKDTIKEKWQTGEIWEKV